MALRETVQQWHADGKLDAEYAQFENILLQRSFSKRQIEFCFNTTLPGLALLAADRETNVLTLDVFRAALTKVMTNEAHFLETCAFLADAQDKPEHEVVKDLARLTANRIWQRTSAEEESD